MCVRARPQISASREINELLRSANPTANAAFRGELIYARFKIRNFSPTFEHPDDTTRRCSRKSLTRRLN